MIPIRTVGDLRAAIAQLDDALVINIDSAGGATTFGVSEVYTRDDEGRDTIYHGAGRYSPQHSDSIPRGITTFIIRLDDNGRELD